MQNKTDKSKKDYKVDQFYLFLPALCFFEGDLDFLGLLFSSGGGFPV